MVIAHGITNWKKKNLQPTSNVSWGWEVITFLGENTKFLSVAIKTHQNKLKNHISKFFSDLEWNMSNDITKLRHLLHSGTQPTMYLLRCNSFILKCLPNAGILFFQRGILSGKWYSRVPDYDHYALNCCFKGCGQPGQQSAFNWPLQILQVYIARQSNPYSTGTKGYWGNAHPTCNVCGH